MTNYVLTKNKIKKKNPPQPKANKQTKQQRHPLKKTTKEIHCCLIGIYKTNMYTLNGVKTV